jgi:hypothetical protein
MDTQPARTRSPFDRSRLRPMVLVFGIGALLCATACGGDGSSGSSPTSVSTPTPRLVQQGTFNLSGPDAATGNVYFSLATMTDASPGRWEATVDWASATNELWMWVANGACTVEQFSRDDCPFDAACPCQFAVRSETATPKPRVLSIGSAQGGARTLIVLNLGPGAETATYRVMLTPSGIVADSLSASRATSTPVSTGRKALARR